MGAKLEIYNDIKDRLTTYVTEIKTIRKWNNQFDNESKEKAFAYPCCFISYSDLQYQKPMANTMLVNQLQSQQLGLSTISLYLGFESLSTESDSWPTIEPIIQKVWSYLQGWSKPGTEYYGPLSRVSEVEDNNHNDVIVWQINFECSLADLATVGDMVDAAPVTLIVNPDLIIDPDTEDDIRTADIIP